MPDTERPDAETPAADAQEAPDVFDVLGRVMIAARASQEAALIATDAAIAAYRLLQVQRDRLGALLDAEQGRTALDRILGGASGAKGGVPRTFGMKRAEDESTTSTQRGQDG